MDKFTRTSDTDVSEIIDIEDDTPKKSKIGNIIAVVVCLLISVIIWLYIVDHDIENYDKNLKDVEINVVAEEGTSYTLSQNKVSVKVSGSKKSFADMKSDSVKAYVDITGLSLGEHEVELRFECEDGLNISVTSSSVQTVKVTVE